MRLTTGRAVMETRTEKIKSFLLVVAVSPLMAVFAAITTLALIGYCTAFLIKITWTKVRSYL